MGQQGVERNTVTYSAVISACRNGGQWEHALRLLEEMGQQGVERNTITYNAAISACKKAKQLAHAKRLHSEMMGSVGSK
jgi:pentatricopeptide repeat domain-containing protein 1